MTCYRIYCLKVKGLYDFFPNLSFCVICTIHLYFHLLQAEKNWTVFTEKGTIYSTRRLLLQKFALRQPLCSEPFLPAVFSRKGSVTVCLQ